MQPQSQSGTPTDEVVGGMQVQMQAQDGGLAQEVAKARNVHG